MKKLLISTLIIAVLGMVIPFASVIAQPSRVPHKNPARAGGGLDTITLLLSYVDILDLATTQQYGDAQALLDEIDLAGIPDEIAFITGRYQELFQQLISAMDGAESLLGEASDLLERRHITEASQRLDSARAHIDEAFLLMSDIELTTETLSEGLGPLAGALDGQLRQAYTSLEESGARLRQLIEDTEGLMEELNEEYVAAREMMPTVLSLAAAAEPVLTGDAVTVSGRLEGGGEALAGRIVRLLLDDNPAGTVETGGGGSFSTTINVPYAYVDTMTLQAVYEPAGVDAVAYQASQSPPVTLDTRYYHTQIQADAPENALPGTTATVSGQVYSDGDAAERTVRVFLDDALLAEAKTADSFNIEVAFPASIRGKQHALTVAAEPYQRYAGAAWTQDIDISRIPLYVDAQAPPFVLLPQEINVTGRVYDNIGPLAFTGVKLSLGGLERTVTTGVDGGFSDTISLPIIPDFSPGGSSFQLSPFYPGRLTVTVAGTSAWYAEASRQMPVSTVNPLSAGLVLAVLAVLAVIIPRRRRVQDSREAAAPVKARIKLPAAAAPRPVIRLTGIKGRVIAAYRAALEAVEKIAGVRRAPQATMREFLHAAALPSRETTGQFAELTSLAETALYSPVKPPEDAAARADDLAAAIKKGAAR